MTLPSLAAPAAARRAAARKRLPSLKLRMGVVCVAMLAAVAASWTSSWTDGGGDAALPRGSGRQLQQDGGSEFPADLISQDAKNQGALVVHFLVMLYMFLGLAIVCDEYFVSALEVICERLDISDDVAGATFMAAGGSAPELFTSFMGVFVARSNVGFGTIVGSAVFNVLAVIGTCAVSSLAPLELTWWPLARDTTVYCITLLSLVGFFADGTILWYESLTLLLLYLFYVFVMSRNVQLYEFVVTKILRKPLPLEGGDEGEEGSADGSKADDMEAAAPAAAAAATAAGGDAEGEDTADEDGDAVSELPAVLPPEMRKRRRKSRRPSRGASAMSFRMRTTFRAGALEMLLGNPAYKTTSMEGAAQLAMMMHLDGRGKGLDASSDKRFARAAALVGTNLKKAGGSSPRKVAVAPAPDASAIGGPPAAGAGDAAGSAPPAAAEEGRDAEATAAAAPATTTAWGDEEEKKGDDGGDDDSSGSGGGEGVNMSWPATTRGRIMFCILAPLTLLLKYTLPDVQKRSQRKYYVVTFVGSIVWIALFSFLMVWWATTIGDALCIPPEVMGVTFLAAGTSIPDMLSSVIVARQGLGDMAVSSSIGSNIFDVTVGLPLPWLCYNIFVGPVAVLSSGLFTSIIVLFVMLVAVIGIVACSHWRMTRRMGYAMFFLYCVFVAQNLMTSYGVI
eukprot:PLAT6755.2.p1 GENE.PLAT6755.2~~PLAT6755.2.p1  ORF type:complete len:678 (+),score=402.06 PLAT6755.2:51-2084(+)